MDGFDHPNNNLWSFFFFCQKIEEKEQVFGANYHLLLYSKTVRRRQIHNQHYEIFVYMSSITPNQEQWSKKLSALIDYWNDDLNNKIQIT